MMRPLVLIRSLVRMRARMLLIALLLVGGASLRAQHNRDTWPMVKELSTLELALNVPGHAAASVKLQRMAVFNGATRIQAMTANGPVDIDPRNFVAYKGTLPDDAKSLVVVVRTRDGLVGSIHAGGKRYTLDRRTAPSDPSPVTIHEVKRAKPSEVLSCRANEVEVPDDVMRIMQEKPRERTQESEQLDLLLAVEADYHFFENTGASRDKAVAYIAQVVGMASAIYERDFNVRIVTGNVRVWETAADPYSDTEPIFSMINEFSDYYEASMTSVPRDVAAFLTMRSGQGGIAKAIGGICKKSLSYCAADLAGDITADPTVFSFDEILLAHELGHICGGVHTQSCLWPGGPLDSCVASERGTCVLWENTKPSMGTVMSYCHQRRSEEGGGVLAEFHPRHKHVVRAYLDRAECVGAQPLKKNCVLRGRVIDADANAPVQGAELHVRSFEDGLYFNPPLTSPDTISITNANGEYEFRGLDDGVYQVILPAEWAVSPISITSANEGVGVMVSGEVVERDIRVVHGRPVSLKVNTGGDATDATFILVSEKLATLNEAIAVPGAFFLLGQTYTQSLPMGSYTLVPHSVGRKFTPPRIDFVVGASDDTTKMEFTTSSTAPETDAVCIAISIATVDGKSQLSPGDTVSIRSNVSSTPEEYQVTGTNGVAVFENRTTDGYHLITYRVDTTQWVSSYQTLIAGSSTDPYPVVMNKRMRRFPLLARPYQLQVSNEPYVPLTDAKRIIAPELMGGGAVPVYLPFNLRIGPEYISKLFVFPGGDVVLGNTPYNGFFGPPLTSYDDLRFVVAALGYTYGADSTALTETGVWWNIAGESPNRQVGIEWRKLKGTYCDEFYNCQPVGTYTFQVRIAESTGIITMHYGEVDPEEGDVLANIGLRGGDKLDTRIITSLDLRPSWSSPEVHNSSQDVYNNLFYNTDNRPANGLMYTWINPATSVDDEAKRDDEATNNDANKQQHFLLSSEVSDVILVGGLEGATICLVDMLGRTLRASSDIPARLNWDVSSYPPGRYTLVVTTRDVQFSQPILITR